MTIQQEIKPDICPTCGHKLTRVKPKTERAAAASRANGAKGGRPAPKYTLIGFTSFAAGSRPKEAIIIGTYGSQKSLERAYNFDKSGLCLEWKEWEPGERAGVDATDIILKR